MRKKCIALSHYVWDTESKKRKEKKKDIINKGNDPMALMRKRKGVKRTNGDTRREINGGGGGEKTVFCKG